MFMNIIRNQNIIFGNQSLLKRFLPLSKEILEMYINKGDSNMFSYVVKSSLYDEYRWKLELPVLYYLSIVLFVCLSIFMVYIILRNIRKINKKIAIPALSLLITNIIAYIIMNIKLPYSFSMNSRYIVLAQLAFLIIFSLAYQRDKDLKNSISGTTLTIIAMFICSFICI